MTFILTSQFKAKTRIFSAEYKQNGVSTYFFWTKYYDYLCSRVYDKSIGITLLNLWITFHLFAVSFNFDGCVVSKLTSMYMCFFISKVYISIYIGALGCCNPYTFTLFPAFPILYSSNLFLIYTWKQMGIQNIELNNWCAALAFKVL